MNANYLYISQLQNSHIRILNITKKPVSFINVKLNSIPDMNSQSGKHFHTGYASHNQPHSKVFVVLLVKTTSGIHH